MNHIFKELLDAGCTIIYIDDILIYHDDLATLERMTEKAVQILDENKLFIKLAKCEFAV